RSARIWALAATNRRRLHHLEDDVDPRRVAEEVCVTVWGPSETNSSKVGRCRSRAVASVRTLCFSRSAPGEPGAAWSLRTPTKAPVGGWKGECDGSRTRRYDH